VVHPPGLPASSTHGLFGSAPRGAARGMTA